MAPLKTKGDMAELLIAADLVKRGYRVAFPFGEDSDFDLIFWEDEQRLERLQAKYATSDGEVVAVRTRSHSLTNGKIRAIKRYTSKSVDWMGVYDATTEQIFYIPATELGDGMNIMHLRLVPARNNQRLRIRMADDYRVPTIRPTGL